MKWNERMMNIFRNILCVLNPRLLSYKYMHVCRWLSVNLCTYGFLQYLCLYFALCIVSFYQLCVTGTHVIGCVLMLYLKTLVTIPDAIGLIAISSYSGMMMYISIQLLCAVWRVAYRDGVQRHLSR